MATTASGDVKIYNPQMQGAFVETIQQNTDAFNAASLGTLEFRTRELRGNYDYEAFFKETSNIARRNPASESSSTVAATKLEQEEFIGVKLNRRNGPYEWNLSAAGLAGFDPIRFSIAVGEQTAVATPKEMIDRALGALEAKLDDTTALKQDGSAATISTAGLISAMSKRGDMAGDVAIWVMHSKPYFDLVAAQVASSNSVFASPAFGAQIFQGAPWSMNRPILVVDSPSLISLTDISTGVPVYSTLGLVRGAATLELTAPPVAVAEGPITGSDNLYIRWQAEYAYNLKLRGCRYNTGSGVNPTNAVVATAGSLVSSVQSTKSLPGVILKSR
jgi:hypothetical protein